MGLIIDRKKNKLPRLDSINFQLLSQKNLLIICNTLTHILQSPKHVFEYQGTANSEKNLIGSECTCRVRVLWYLWRAGIGGAKDVHYVALG